MSLNAEKKFLFGLKKFDDRRRYVVDKHSFFNVARECGLAFDDEASKNIFRKCFLTQDDEIDFLNLHIDIYNHTFKQDDVSIARVNKGSESDKGENKDIGKTHKIAKEIDNRVDIDNQVVFSVFQTIYEKYDTGKCLASDLPSLLKAEGIEVTDALRSELRKNKYDLSFSNFVNASLLRQRKSDSEVFNMKFSSDEAGQRKPSENSQESSGPICKNILDWDAPSFSNSGLVNKENIKQDNFDNVMQLIRLLSSGSISLDDFIKHVELNGGIFDQNILELIKKTRSSGIVPFNEFTSAFRQARHKKENEVFPEKTCYTYAELKGLSDGVCGKFALESKTESKLSSNNLLRKLEEDPLWRVKLEAENICGNTAGFKLDNLNILTDPLQRKLQNLTSSFRVSDFSDDVTPLAKKDLKHSQTENNIICGIAIKGENEERGFYSPRARRFPGATKTVISLG